MKLGLLTGVIGNHKRAEAFAICQQLGLDCVELGTGEFSSDWHVGLEEIVSDDAAVERLNSDLADHGLEISALSCHCNALHPNPAYAERAQAVYTNTVLAAERLGVEQICLFAGCPGTPDGGEYPNWVSTGWPTYFTELLEWQWSERIIPFWSEHAAFAADHKVRLAFEMHPGDCVFNLETLLRLREGCGENVGSNFDPSHLWWQLSDPLVVARELGERGMLYHVHAKDTYIDLGRTARDGVLATHRPGRSEAVMALCDRRIRTRRHLLEGARLHAASCRLRRRPQHRARGPARTGDGGTRADRRASSRRHLDRTQRLALVARRSTEPDHPGESGRAELMVMKLSMIHWMREEPLEQTVARLASAGYDGLEINGEPDHYDAVEVRDILDRHGIVLWGAVTLMEHGGRDMVHPDRFVRVGTQRYLQDTIQLIADLGGQVLCCVPSTIGKTQPLTTPSTEWQWCIDGLRAAGEFAGERGVKIALEPITRFETYLLNRAEQALAMVEDVDLSNVGVCLDTYHMHQEEQDPLQAIRTVGDRLFDFHVADSNRRPPGQGAVDWPPILRALDEIGYTGHLTAEVDPPRDRSRLATVPEEDGQFAGAYYDQVVAATPAFLRTVRTAETTEVRS